MVAEFLLHVNPSSCRTRLLSDDDSSSAVHHMLMAPYWADWFALGLLKEPGVTSTLENGFLVVPRGLSGALASKNLHQLPALFQTG